MCLASHKIDIGNGADPYQTPQNVASDQGLHSLPTGNYIRNRIKMIQDTWQPLNDKMTSLIAKDCIFLRKIWFNRFTVCAKRLQDCFSRRSKSATIAIAL